jgi:small subunit ribosomal protein S21
LKVTVVDNDIEKALKKFKKKVQRAGVLKDVRTHLYFEKPSVRRKRKQSEALKKRKRAIRVRKLR